MKRCWLLGIGAILVLLVLNQALSFGGHGHAGGSHPAKEGHEAPKHSGGKPAPKPSPKPQAKPQGKPKSNDSHKQAPGKSRSLPHESNLNRPNSIGSSSNAHEQSTKNDKTTHQEHHGWHHDRWWHGHHHLWSEEGFWVDAATGLPVVAGDGGVPGSVVDGAGPSPTSGAAIAGCPQIHFSVDSEERESYDAAARAAGMSRAEWIRNRLNAAVSKELR